jgi:hypothetical protein
MLRIRPASNAVDFSLLMGMPVGVFASGGRDLYAAFEFPHAGWPWKV